MAFCVNVDRRAIGEDGGEHYFIARKAFGEREKTATTKKLSVCESDGMFAQEAVIEPEITFVRSILYREHRFFLKVFSWSKMTKLFANTF